MNIKIELGKNKFTGDVYSQWLVIITNSYCLIKPFQLGGKNKIKKKKREQNDLKPKIIDIMTVYLRWPKYFFFFF